MTLIERLKAMSGGDDCLIRLSLVEIESLRRQLAEFKHGQDAYQQLFNDEKAENTKLRQQVTLLRSCLKRWAFTHSKDECDHMEVAETLAATEPK